MADLGIYNNAWFCRIRINNGSKKAFKTDRCEAEGVSYQMKKYKNVTVTTETIDYIKCDLCGLVADRADWTTGSYEVNETEFKLLIRHREGENYPETGWGTEYLVDMCPNCFKNKLIPWLDSQGCTAKRKDWDY